MNLSMRWRKVLGDLRQSAPQIGAIMLVLGLGAAGVTAALHGRGVLEREIESSFAMARVPDLALLLDRVNPAALAAVAAHEDVEAVDARRVVYARVLDRTGVWLTLRLVVIQDFNKQALGRVHRHGEAWPDATKLDENIFIEQSGEPLLDVAPGSPVQIRRQDGDIVMLRSAGAVHDPAVAPSFQERMVYGYATPAVAARLGLDIALDQLLVKLTYRGSNSDVLESANRLRGLLQRQGIASIRADVLPAGHPHAMLMNAMLRVLGVMSALAFACSAGFVAYMMAAWMRREQRIVGVMKAIGARWQQIALQYLFLTVPLVLLTVALALPAGDLLGRALVRYYAASLNIDIAQSAAPLAVWRLAVMLALGIPFVAMTLPILRAALMTAQAAIQDPGIAPLNTAGRIAAHLIRWPGRLRATFALRNVWRRPWRTVLMVLGLSFGGALLLLTHTNYKSMMAVIDTSLANRGHDIDVVLPRTAPAAALLPIAERAQDVEIAEAWRRASVAFARVESLHETEGRVSRGIGITGYPDATRLFKLPVVVGRMPAAGATTEVIITRAFHHAFPQVQVGQPLELDFRDRRSVVTVTGMVDEIASVRMYAPFSAFESITGLGDASSVLRIKARGDDLPAVMRSLDEAFIAARMAPLQLQSRDVVREALEEHFKVVGDVVRMVALAVALVGAILLVSTTLLNLMERKREIGVLRALGAAPGTLVAIFLAEGIAVTAISALFAFALSIPISLAMLRRAETSLLHVAVPLQFSMTGLGILLSGALVVVVTALVLISVNLKQSVREAIAYE
jgi:putative ABC transport system permease protein